MFTPSRLAASLDVQEILHESSLTLVVRGRRRGDGLPLVAKVVAHTDAARMRLERLRHERLVLQHIARHGPPHVQVSRVVDWMDTGDAWGLLLADSGGLALRPLLRSGPLALEEALNVAAGVAQALRMLHGVGILHKDVCSRNIVYNRHAASVELIDFGTASLLPRDTQSVELLWGLEGTPAYVSPEQTGHLGRPIDGRADLYSLGVCLYEMLTGSLPFVQQVPTELIEAILTQPPVPPRVLVPALPEVVNALVMRLLEKAPERRYHTARGLEHDLRRLAFDFANAEGGDHGAWVLGEQDQAGRDDVPHLEELLARRTHQLREAHEKLVKIERDATEIQMAGGFAHEVRNALAGTHYALESLLGDEPVAQVHDVLALARRGIERSMRITDEILNYAQVAQLVVRGDQTSLGSVVDAVLEDMGSDLHALNIACVVDVPTLDVRAQETHAFAMVRNLISNARDALSQNEPDRRRELQVRGRVVAGEAVLEVQDNGVGMTEEVQARLFRPFFSTKGAKGRGLGLGLSRKLAQAYHGDLRFTSRAKEGSTFELRLPLA